MPIGLALALLVLFGGGFALLLTRSIRSERAGWIALAILTGLSFLVMAAYVAAAFLLLDAL